MTDLTHPAPALSEAEATEISRVRFGVEGRLSRLNSERDQNFRVDATDGSRWILKVINAGEPREQSDFQTALLDHLAVVAPELPLPRLRRTLDGDALTLVPMQREAPCAVRMVSWQSGVPLAEATRSPTVLHNLGITLGRLNRAMQGFMHPGALRTFEWDMRAAGSSRDRLRYVRNVDDRAVLACFIDRFDRGVAPCLPSLRAAIIHNDANDWNVLVDREHTDKISGLIDFGDALHTVLIFEVAVACAYSILGLEDPIEAAATIAAAFHQEQPLQEREIELLFDLIAMRLVTSVTLSAQRKDMTSDNPYLLVSEAPAWEMLRRLAEMDRGLAVAIIRRRCGLEAYLGARSVQLWLKESAGRLRSALEPHPAVLRKQVVPCGEAGGPLPRASAQERPETEAADWEAYRRSNGVDLGVGSWGEGVTPHVGSKLESPFIAGRKRTFHLGLDLFESAGTKLHAPLASVVREVLVEDGEFGRGCLVLLEHKPDGCPPFATLWGHLGHEARHRLKPGDRLAAGDLIGEIGGVGENGERVPHLHLQLSVDPARSVSRTPGMGEARYKDVWGELFPDPATFAGLPRETFTRSGRSRADIVAARRRSLLLNLSTSYAEPVKFVRGEGVWLIDDNGRAYLDCFNNVSHLGHAHPEIVAALARQASLLNTNTRYLHDNIVDYAERLTGTLPGDLTVASFCCTGSEANSLMLRMMRAHTRREDIIVLDGAYHGTTQELVDISPYKYKQKGGEGRKPFVHEASVPNTYHAPASWPADDYAKRYADSVFEQIELMRGIGKAPGLFLAETLPSVAGQLVLPDNYLALVYEMVRSAGGVCAADEVQVGFGRVGSHWWAFETQGVVPDILTLGKPIGNGHPMSAVVTTREIAASFNNGMEYFNTFGGNPVSCAVGLAVMDVIERDGLRRNALEIGDYLLRRLGQLQSRYKCIGDVRGKGLFLGIELVTSRTTKEPATDLARAVNNEVKRLGVLIGTEGPYDNVLKLRPPMIFSRAHADYLLQVLGEAFATVTRAY